MTVEPNTVITAIISTSPIYCHPSTEIIDETIAQLRKHLPTVKICILFDGVHPEQEHLRWKYVGYKAAVKHKHNCWIESEPWQHQSGMLRELFDSPKMLVTPLIFWTEHDLPLRNDPLPWQQIVDTLLNREADVIRFKMNEEGKPNLEREKIEKNGLPLLRTYQHLAWPQVIRVDFLKQFIASFGNDKTYFDDGTRDGYLLAHPENKVYMYDPPADSRRCYHNSGRERGLPFSTEHNKPFVEISGRTWYMNGKYEPGRTEP